ncbi:hypothetical protein [Paraclostridium dentum]|uniref:hypothetical protein n=1 Tax=Paraclostridium dentum TaxID=2662455 RepID=UPI003F2F8397
MKKETSKKAVIEEVTEELETQDKDKTVEMIAEDLKAIHKEVYVTDIAGLKVVWRKLKRSEYKELMVTEFSENEELSFLEKQDFVANKVILYPENVEELLEEYAGIADIIATETMVKTGFGITNTRSV